MKKGEKDLKPSFNPSFTGIALVASNTQHPKKEKKLFQSFFYWNCLGGCGHLFFFNHKNKSFNPSFTGIALVAFIV